MEIFGTFFCCKNGKMRIFQKQHIWVKISRKSNDANLNYNEEVHLRAILGTFVLQKQQNKK